MQINGSIRDESLDRFRKRIILGVLCFLFVAVPVLNVLGVVDNTHVNKLGRYLCFAIVALGIDLLWGYTGLLGLCQAFFFCLGGYAMAMHLSLPEGGGNVRPEYHNIPQFFFLQQRGHLAWMVGAVCVTAIHVNRSAWLYLRSFLWRWGSPFSAVE